MPSFTSRLKLKKAAGTENVKIADLNDNFDTIDDMAGIKICTSTTRPAVPFDGQLIRETDTELVLVWDADDAKWRYVAGPVVMYFQGAANVGTGNGTPWGFSAGSSIDVAKSRNPSWIGTIDTNERIKITEAGVYAISVHARMGAPIGAGVRCFVDLSDGSGASLARSNIVLDDYGSTGVAGGLWLAANTILSPATYQQSGGVLNRVDASMRITRHG